MAPGDDRELLDSGLISRVVAEGDQAAFTELVRRHQSPIRQFLRRLTRLDTARADDLAQETFWKAYRNLAGYRGEGRFRSWLFKIAYQIFVTDERKHGRVQFSPLPHDLASTSSEVERVVSKRTVEQLLGRLRDKERAAILLHYQHQLTHPEIAAGMGLPLGTVKTLIRRGREKMRPA